MGFVDRAVLGLGLQLVVMAVLLQVSHAADYKVGDSAGWTIIGNIDYKQWAATKTFQVGDIIRKFNLCLYFSGFKCKLFCSVSGISIFPVGVKFQAIFLQDLPVIHN